VSVSRSPSPLSSADCNPCSPESARLRVPRSRLFRHPHRHLQSCHHLFFPRLHLRVPLHFFPTQRPHIPLIRRCTSGRNSSRNTLTRYYSYS
jgi:hypothetical protein